MLSVKAAIRKLNARRTSSKLAEIGRLYSTSELEALTQDIATAFESMVEAHNPGCAIVGANSPDSPLAVTVIPANTDAAEISIEFRQSSRTTILIHIGAYGELPGWEGVNAKQSQLSAAMGLFQLVLEGRYREDAWVNVKTGRYEGGQSYLSDGAGAWHALGSFREPAVPFSRLRLQDERFASY